jgi:hypothetical protein
MARLSRAIRSVRVTPLAIGLLAVLAVSAGVAAFGPKHAQLPAFIVAVVVLAIFAVGAFPGGLRGGRLKHLPERQEQFHAREREQSESSPDPALEAQLWQRERERYEREDKPS